MSKSTSLTVLGVVALAGLLAWGYTSAGPSTDKSAQNAGAAGALVADASAYSFGSVPINGGLIEHTFVLKNDSDSPVRIYGAETSCMCTTAYLVTGDGERVGPFGMAGHGGTGDRTDITVNPGEDISVVAIFDPAAHGPAGLGTVERFIAIDTGNGTSATLSFNVTVTP